jgi:selenoprotein W-related protein
LTAELLEQFEPEIEQITLVPSDGGRFEVEVDGVLVFSKLQTGRFADPGEMVALVRAKLNR